MQPRRKRGSNGLALRLTLLVLAVAGVWTFGLLRFVGNIPDALEDGSTGTDAIVVLTGGSGRLDAGLDLLAQDLADKLFVSGVYRGLDVKKLLSLAERTQDLGARVGIGNAVNTQENAQETAVWIRDKGYSSLRLVTAAYHMPRSLLEFRRAMPDVRIVSHPVFPEHVKMSEWWAWPGTAALVIGEYNKTLVASIRHGVVIALRWFGPEDEARTAVPTTFARS